TGRLPWDSTAAPPIFLSYHRLPRDGVGFVAFEGERTRFPALVAPGDSATVDVTVRAPDHPGEYRLEWDLVQEGRLWFSTEPGAVRTLSHVIVSGAEYDGPLHPTPPPRPTVRPGRFQLWRAAARMFVAHPF